jgi:hypothetical protein
MKLFPLATLIRLYELLKNSRSIREQSRDQQQSSLAFDVQAAWVLIFGGRPEFYQDE